MVGRRTNISNKTPHDRERDALLLLGVPIGATEEDIRQAHRLLCQVWHPDRFSGNPKLQAQATSRLAEINAAYDVALECIKDGGAHRQPSAPDEPESMQLCRVCGTQYPKAAAHCPRCGPPAPPPTVPRPARSPTLSTFRDAMIITIGAIVTIIVIQGLLLPALDKARNDSRESRFDAQLATCLGELKLPRGTFFLGSPRETVFAAIGIPTAESGSDASRYGTDPGAIVGYQEDRVSSFSDLYLIDR